MTPMDHAEAHERIADLALEPSRLAGLTTSAAAEDAALREHVRACQQCQAELREWDDFQSSLGDALADNRREQLEPIVVPADLRRRVLTAAHDDPKPAAVPDNVVVLHSRRLPLSRTGLLALAAVFALVAAGVGMLVMRDQASRLDASALEHRWLTDTVAAINRILVTPDHHVITLATTDGVPAGTLAWSRHDLVVVSGHLPAPAAGQVYRCWLNYDGQDTPMGFMWFVDGSAFWTSSTDDWAAIDPNPEKQFLVTLESASNVTDHHTGPIVLQASLGS
jgi:Anti-sigma-K factor rskA, C-terminal